MKKWSSGKIAGAILGGVAAVVVLWVSLVVSIYHLANFLSEDEYASSNEISVAQEREERNRTNENSSRDYEKRRVERDEDDDYRRQEEYYEFSDALRDDLFYQVSFESYEKDDFQTIEDQGEAAIVFTYPIVSGDVTNLDGINDAIQKELHVVTDHVSSVVEFLDEDETYLFMGEAYVTYMSEELLSVAYVEYGYLEDEYLESYVVSVNVDMETGMVLDNTQLLKFDDSFSVDFRERCERQNGEIDSLDYMSDQEMTSYFLDNDYLIALYTPMGMEIGFNFYDGWVTVTYKDYERYKMQF